MAAKRKTARRPRGGSAPEGTVAQLDEEAARIAVARASGLPGLAEAELTLIAVAHVVDELRDPTLGTARRAKLTRLLARARNALRGVSPDFTGTEAFHFLFRVLEDGASYYAWLKTTAPKDGADRRVIVVESARRRLAEYTSLVTGVPDRDLFRAIERWADGGPRAHEAARELAEKLGIPTRVVSMKSIGEYISRWRKSTRPRR